MASIAVSAVLGLSGCATSQAKLDYTPAPLNKNNSFAMQVLESGFNPYVPFDIEDAELPEDAYQNVLNYGTSSAVGLLAGGAMGALKGLGWAAVFNSGSNPAKSYIQYIAYIPAENIDINDKGAINSYIKKNYITPALESYIASDENKNQVRPTKLLDFANGEYKIKGEACYAVKIGEPEYDGCQLFWNANTHIIRYATTETGLPFKPTAGAGKYIVARITDPRMRSSVILKHIKSELFYAYVPAMGYKTEHISRLTKDIVFNDTPTIVGKDGKINFFVKKKM